MILKKDLPLFGNFHFIYTKKVADYEWHSVFAEKKTFS